MGDQASINEKVDLFYKKSQGVPYAYPDEDGNKRIGLEPALNARARTFASKQLFQKDIPTSVSLNGSDLSGEVDLSMNGAIIGKYRNHLTNPYVRKYIDIKLSSINRLRSYWTKGATETDVSSNILSNAIPYNYEPGKSYSPEVKIDGNPVSSDSGLKQWYFDTDAGVLTFFNNLEPAENDKVTITFWRYIGPMGLDGLGSGTSANAVTTDNLYSLFSNIPDVSFNPVVSRANTIFLTWKYPNQTPFNFPNVPYVPYINSIKTLVEFSKDTSTGANVDQIDVSAEILTAASTDGSANYVRLNAQSTPITGIALMKQSNIAGRVSGQIYDQPLTINGVTATYKIYYYYNAGLAQLDGSANKLYVVYMGNTDRPYNVFSTFTVYLIPGKPSAPRDLSGNANTYNRLDISYNAPEFADVSNNTDPSITIIRYNANFANPTDTQNRYTTYTTVGTALDVSSQGLTMNSGTLLTPETLYDISVNATNSHPLSGPYTGPIKLRTQLLPASVAYSGVSGEILNTTITPKFLNGTQVNSANLRLVSGNGTTTVPVYVGAAKFDITQSDGNGFRVPVHSETQRGVSGEVILSTLKVDISGGALTGLSSEVYDYKGFGSLITLPGPSSITIAPGSYVDVPTGAPTLQGWYRVASGVSASISAGTGRITTSNNEYEVNLSVIQDGTTEFVKKSFTKFRYSPAVSSAPTIHNGSMTILSPTTKVSGVSVLGGSFDISGINYDLSGMGANIYYYPSDKIITYSTVPSYNVVPNTEANLINVTNGIVDEKFDTGVIKITRSEKLAITANTFSTAVALQAKGKNISQEASTASNISSVSVIVDPLSVALLSNTDKYNRADIPTISALNTYVAGAHRFSSGSNKTTQPLVVDYASGIENTYDHAVDLSSNDLQIANGLFRGRNNTLVGYLNYTSTLGNTANYSSIQLETGYRFATFVWKFNTTFDSPSVSAMTFNFTDANGLTNNNTKLYYRFIGTDVNNNVVTSLDSTANTSLWAAGTQYAGQNVSVNLDSFTFADTNRNGQVLNGYSSGNLPTVQVRISKPSAFDSSVQRTKYIVARVAIKMDSDATFSGLQLKLE